LSFSRTGWFAFWTAIAGSLFLPLARLVVLPFYEAGHWQSPLSVVNGLAYLLQIPCAAARGAAAHQLASSSSAASNLVPQVAYAATNFLVCFALGMVVHGIYRALRPARRRPPRPAGDAIPSDAMASDGARHEDAQPQTPIARRDFLKVGAGGLALVGCGAASYAQLVQPRWFTVSRFTHPMPGLPPALDGLRLVQLSDIHHGPWLSRAHVRRVVRAANDLRADLVVLTGDYVHTSPDYIAPVVEALAKLKASIGVVAVLGNHDWWEDGPYTRHELARHGIAMLDNTRLVVSSGRRLEADASEGLCIAGVGDFWEDEQLYGSALGGVPEAMPRVLLSHNPDVAEEASLEGHRVDLMLSGHTHGGQILLPMFNPVSSVSRYGSKYTHGLVQGPRCDVYISAGIGMVGLPMRIGTTPEITVVELKAVPARGPERA